MHLHGAPSNYPRGDRLRNYVDTTELPHDGVIILVAFLCSLLRSLSVVRLWEYLIKIMHILFGIHRIFLGIICCPPPSHDDDSPMVCGDVAEMSSKIYQYIFRKRPWEIK